MRSLLESQGVASDQITDESDSHDTLSSVIHCSEVVRRRFPADTVYACSDRYHIPRIRWLFHLLGVPTMAANMPSGLKANGPLQWSYYYVRETAALMVDTAILLVRGRA